MPGHEGSGCSRCGGGRGGAALIGKLAAGTEVRLCGFCLGRLGITHATTLPYSPYQNGKQEAFWGQVEGRLLAMLEGVAADLRLMQRFYEQPSDNRIEAYMTELVELLVVRGVDTVTYGFKKDGAWVVALRYVAAVDGNLTADDRAGRVPPGIDITGGSWSSFLTHSSHWWELPATERAGVEALLPFQRTAGEEPSPGNGYWVEDKTYSADGGGVRRATFRPL